MATTALKQITAEAKRLRKQHPRLEWKAAIQQASKKFNRGALTKSKPAAKKKAAPKKKAAKRSVPLAAKRPAKKAANKKVGTVLPHGTVISHVNAGVRLLEGSLAALQLRHFRAKTKTEKKQIGKSIAHTKQQIRALAKVKGK